MRPIGRVFVLGLLMFSISLAVNISVKDGVADIKFDHYPVFNVTVNYIKNGLEFHKHVLSVDRDIVIPYVDRVTSVIYDNSTWLKIVGNKLDVGTGNLELSGETEDAATCMQGRSVGRDADFWSKPENCFENITVYVDGNPVKSVFADKNGTWSVVIPLSPGSHKIVVEAKDPGQNLAKAEIDVTWNPKTPQILGYYLSKPEVQGFLAVAVIMIIALFFLHIRGKRAKQRKIEEMEKTLTQAFEELKVELSKYQNDLIKAVQEPEVQAKIRQVLLNDPFYSFIKDSASHYKTAKESGDLEAWKADFTKGLDTLLKRHDPLVQLYHTDYYILLSAYHKVAASLVKEMAEKK